MRRMVLPSVLGRLSLVAGVALVAAGALVASTLRAAEEGVVIPAPALDPAPASAGLQKAVVAGGCFWGIQGVFQHAIGVTSVISGYAGGTLKNPTYEDVTTERTGHAEAVEITYDPAKISYGTLLRILFSVGHDPTQLNRQGPDVGPSYRSNIFYLSDAQKAVADAYIAQLNGARVFSRPIVTRVDRFTNFYRAEDYHQDFLVNHPTYPYIVINDLPKVENFKRLLPALYREAPALVFK